MSMPQHVADQVYSAVVSAAPIVIMMTSMWTAICVVALGARIFLQIWDRNRFYLEDGVMLAAMVFQVICQACLLAGWRWELELIFTDLELDYRIRINKWAWIATVPGNLSSVLARISITILHIRLFELASKPWLKYFLVVFSSLVTVAGLVDLVVVWVQPRPIQRLWDPRISVEWWNPSLYQTSQIVMLGLFALSDLIHVLVPIIAINRLQMRWDRKLIPVTFIGIPPLLTIGSTLLRLYITIIFSNMTHLVDYAGVVNGFASNERCLVILMGCAPTLRPSKSLQLNSGIIHTAPHREQPSPIDSMGDSSPTCSPGATTLRISIESAPSIAKLITFPRPLHTKSVESYSPV